MPPIAIAAASPTARVSVATAMITNIRKKRQHELPEERLRSASRTGSVAPTWAMFAERAAQDAAAASSAPASLRGPVAHDARPREVAGQREREA